MFRTIKLKLPYNNALIETSKQFKEATQIVLDYGVENKTFNKNMLNKGTYRTVKDRIPTLPYALVQSSKDTASEALSPAQMGENGKGSMAPSSKALSRSS
ncbi:MAG: hypothetical protein ACP5RS_03725 [Thermoplasmata archaeon]